MCSDACNLYSSLYVSEILGTRAACGGAQTVLGDAFVARAYDNEAEDMVRLDFTLEEVKDDARKYSSDLVGQTDRFILYHTIIQSSMYTVT